jgi:hypothetical protein
VRARCRLDASQTRLVVSLEDDSQSVQALAVTCLSASHAVAELVPPAAVPWTGSCLVALALQRGPAAGEAPLLRASAVAVAEEGSRCGAMRAEDALLRAAHAGALERDRAARKAEARRKDMERLGQLPVTIQDVRRLRLQQQQSAWRAAPS